MERKKLTDVSLNWDEERYRATGMHHSTLSRFANEGFEGLDKLFDKIKSPSLTFGSAVDCLVTEGSQAFNDAFEIAEYKVSDKGIKIINELYNLYGKEYKEFDYIPNDIVSAVAKSCDFWQGDKWDNKRYSEVLNCGDVAKYYNILASEKNTLDVETASKVFACVDKLRTSEATKKYFGPNKDTDIERFYQVIFCEEIDGITYAIKFDEVIVNHKNKEIQLVDLKTTGKKETLFAGSVITYRYDIQARLYYQVIKRALKKDDFFKDYKILTDFHFVVINKDNLDPLVFSFPASAEGEMKITDRVIFKDPFTIAKELNTFLIDKDALPRNIKRTEPNDIITLIETY